MHTSNKVLAWVALLSGLLISGIAEYFSIIGLSKIFAGAFWPIVIMGSALGIGKLSGISWLFRYWKTAPKAMVGTLGIIVLSVMLLTSTGVFGYLSKSYNEVYAPIQAQQIQIDLVDKNIAAANDRIATDKASMAQLDRSINTLMDKDKVENSLVYRQRQTKERQNIDKDTKDQQAILADLEKQRSALLTTTQGLSADVGPIGFIAKSLFKTDSKDAVDEAVKFVIGLLVLVLDPLAIILLLAANYAFTNDTKPLPARTNTEVLYHVVEPDKPIDEPVERVYYEPVLPDDADEVFVDTLDGDDISLAGPPRSRVKRKLL
jgi:hypothetical protein